MSDDPTTARARRQQAVASGDRSAAVDRVSGRSNPGGRAAEGSTRSRLRDTAAEVASDAGISREGVGAIDRIRGMDVFLRGPGPREFASEVASEFAGSADFVETDDVNARVDRQAIAADPVIADDRRDDVAQRAREQTASEAEFVRAADLDVEVGDRGVRGLEIASDRRDDVAERTRTQLAADDPYAQPGDFDADVSASGIESAGLTDPGARRRAGRQFEAETALGAVDPESDVTADGDAFALTGSAQRRLAARQFEADSPAFGSGDLDPSSDIRETGGGFGLSPSAAREAGAATIDERLSDTAVSPDDVTLEETDSGGFEAVFEQGGGR